MSTKISLSCYVSFEAANILSSLSKRNKQLRDFMTNDNCHEFFSFTMWRTSDGDYLVMMESQLYIGARDMYEKVKGILKHWVMFEPDGTPCWEEDIYDGSMLYKTIGSPFKE